MEGCIKFNRGAKTLLLSPRLSFPGKVELQQGIPAASLGTPPAGHISYTLPAPHPSPGPAVPTDASPAGSPGTTGGGQGTLRWQWEGTRLRPHQVTGASLSLLLPPMLRLGLGCTGESIFCPPSLRYITCYIHMYIFMYTFKYKYRYKSIYSTYFFLYIDIYKDS